MNIEQYEELTKPGVEKAVDVLDLLEDKSDRTLVYGYHLDRTTFHLYLFGGQMYLAEYSYGTDPVVINAADLSPQALRPSKRAYPEACDAEFAGIMKRIGHELCFTTFNPDREPKPYYGEVALEHEQGIAPSM